MNQQDISSERTFEDMLADPAEQFDLRSELLASILSYSTAAPAAASTQPWLPHQPPGAHYVWLTGSNTSSGPTAA